MTKIDAPTDPKPEETVFLDEKLRMAWERYSSVVYIICGLGAAAILAKGGLNYLAAQKELGVQKDYVADKTSDGDKQFVTEHRGHPLAALVELKIADETYMSGKFAEAATGYEKAVVDLPAGPFRSRARLGQAMALAQSGKTSDAEGSLRQILDDENELKSVRCEAGYNLAELAVSSGRSGDVQKLAERLMQIDPTSPFAERAFALRSEVAAPGLSAGAIAVPPAR
jgi:tetratricopeptide (TPR) repeat protein